MNIKFKFVTTLYHDDVNKWKHFTRYWHFVRGIHRSPVNSAAQRSVTRTFDVFFDLRLNKRSSKQSWGWWFFETLSRSLWRHCSDRLWFFFLDESNIYDTHQLTPMPISAMGQVASRQQSHLTNPKMYLFHIGQCTIQNRNVPISALNGVLWGMDRCIVRFVRLAYCWGRYPGTLVSSPVPATHLKIGHPYMKSTGAHSSNEL